MGEQKIAKMVAILDQDVRHAYIWYKPLKIFSRIKLVLGLIFAQIIGDGSSTKIAKMMVLR